MNVDPEVFIFKALESAPKLEGVDGQLYMYDLYESNYGLFNHLQRTIQKPLASVALHRGEDLTDSSGLAAALKVYIDNDIGGFTKLSFVEYLELPSHVLSVIVEQCQQASRAKSDTLRSVEKGLKDLS